VIRTSKKSTHYTKRQAAVLQKAKKKCIKKICAASQAKPSARGTRLRELALSNGPQQCKTSARTRACAV